jgi:hypothetical protein
MFYLGTITKVRDHPRRPVQVDLDVGDGALDLGWVMVAVHVWGAAKFSDFEPGVQVQVWDTGKVGDDDKYRVVAMFPDKNLELGSNQHALARANDPIAISGSVQLTPLAAPTILLGAPPIASLGHDLVGRIVGDG